APAAVRLSRSVRARSTHPPAPRHVSVPRTVHRPRQVPVASPASSDRSLEHPSALAREPRLPTLEPPMPKHEGRRRRPPVVPLTLALPLLLVAALAASAIWRRRRRPEAARKAVRMIPPDVDNAKSQADS